MTSGPVKPSLHLSKSLFTRGLQCHKSLYLHKHYPEFRDELLEEQKAIFQRGSDVGALARELFPDGVEVPYEGLSVAEQLAMTAREISGGRKTLYEAAFSAEDIFVKADVLHKGPDGWELYEVKSTAGVKPQHLPDVAVQYYVLTSAGLPVSKACLVHLNNQYVRQGDLQIGKLFSIEELTPRVLGMQRSVVEQIAAMREMLKGSEPAIDIGPYCDDPYPCDFRGHCWQHVPEDSVFTLRGQGANRFDLYHSGVHLLRDIPLDTLNSAQRFQVEAFINKSEVLNEKQMRAFLDSLWYPLYFLDFETFNPAVPPFDGTRPYQQIPFQYSLHYLEGEGAELKHQEYLARPDTDPRGELLDRLLSEIPDDGCVLAYHASFEQMILQSLANWFPAKRARIECIVANLRDYEIPFKRRDVYHWQQMGSSSQKVLLPLLVPELSYDGLEVADGGAAMDTS